MSSHTSDPFEAIADEARSLPRHTRILLVEDDAAMRSVLADALRGEGYAADAAFNCAGAVSAMLTQHGSPDEYDVIVSDVRMSAFATPEVVREGTEAGAIEVLAKPFDLSRLMTLLHDVVIPRTSEIS